MPSDYQYIMLVGGLVLLVVLCFGAFVFFMARELRVGGGQPSHMTTDVTNMMILFQTMRDILTQQKDLAREFNISIDKKVNEVRRLLQSNGDVRAELDRTKREMAALAARTRREMAALERRLGQVDTEVAAAADEGAAQGGPDAIEEVEAEIEAEVSAAIEILPGEPTREDPSDLIDRWTRGEEFETEPDSDEDASSNGTNGHGHEEEVESEDTRAAYRDLLNLQPAGRAKMPSSSDILDAGREAGGVQYLTPIQQRVYEYSDAGMRVPEIARELGVGKGEVRLILSLRQDRNR
jgi:hypothetical protein